MNTYRAHRFWSPLLGTDAERLSMADEHNGEHFKIIAVDGTFRENRRAREEALDAIQDAIERGDEPGEVR